MNSLKTVIVISEGGFIGTNFVRLLVKGREYRVVNLDALSCVANTLSLLISRDIPIMSSCRKASPIAGWSAPCLRNAAGGCLSPGAESHVDRSIVNAEERQGMMISCPDEIAYRRKRNITKEQLLVFA